HTSVTRLAIIFFYQAEDGIRDFHVTGVQTCALPILPPSSESLPHFRRPLPINLNNTSSTCEASEYCPEWFNSRFSLDRAATPVRSEERRVGKDCSYMLVLELSNIMY